jgi:hypothetical protein
MQELWLPIPGYLGYEASDQGNIQSLDRVVQCITGPRKYKGKMLPATPTTQGYRSVFLPSPDRKWQSQRVAPLILLTFVGPRPFPEAVARHLNDVRYDDRLANLEWGTQKQNAADAIRNGVMPQGEQRYNAKLTEDEVLAIRAAAEMGVSQKAIAAQYGIGQPSVSRIIRRKKWSHV